MQRIAKGGRKMREKNGKDLLMTGVRKGMEKSPESGCCWPEMHYWELETREKKGKWQMNSAATIYREPKWGENGYLNLNRPM